MSFFFIIYRSEEILDHHIICYEPPHKFRRLQCNGHGHKGRVCFVTTYVKPSSDSCYWWTSWSPSSCHRCTERHQMAVTSYKSVAWLKDEAALRQPVACSAAWRCCLLTLSSYEVLMPSFMLVSLFQKKKNFSSTQPSCPRVCLTLNNSVRNWQNSHLQGHLSTRSAGIDYATRWQTLFYQQTSL